VCCEWPAAWGVMLWDTNPAWPFAEDQSATTDHCARFPKSKKLTLRERGDRRRGGWKFRDTPGVGVARKSHLLTSVVRARFKDRGPKSQTFTPSGDSPPTIDPETHFQIGMHQNGIPLGATEVGVEGAGWFPLTPPCVRARRGPTPPRSGRTDPHPPKHVGRTHSLSRKGDAVTERKIAHWSEDPSYPGASFLAPPCDGLSLHYARETTSRPFDWLGVLGMVWDNRAN